MKKKGSSAGLIKRSFTLCGHQTSVALEPDFWDFLEEDAKSQCLPLSRLLVMIDLERAERSLASALRLYVLRRLRAFAPLS